MRRIAASCQILLLAAALAACSGRDGRHSGEIAARADDAANAYPANYKSDLLAMLRVYLNDPTNVREAGLTEPFVQPVGGRNRFAVCVRLSARKSSGDYAAAKEHVAYFLHGRLDQMIEANHEQCAEASYQAFPEAEKLTR
jgi:hypothetical protein